MRDSEIHPIDHPAAWDSNDIASKDDFAIDLRPRHIDALKDSIAAWNAPIDDHGAVSPETFALAEIADDIAAWRREIHDRRGILLLRGFPVDGIDPHQMRLMYIGLGSHFGEPVSQSAMGDLIGDVVNIGGDDKRERAYRSSRALMLHTDRCDHIAMLCVRPAIKGGLSGYASALTIHNRILAERPDLIAPLYRGFFHHRFGEQPAGEPPVTAQRIPIFSQWDGVPSVILIRGYIDLAVEEGLVTLSPIEREALDFVNEVANRPDVRLDVRLEPGEICLTNNCLLLHTRTAFEDAADPAQKRLLLRLWLRQSGRPMAPGVALHKGSGGIQPRTGKGTYYTPSTGMGG